MPVMWVNNKIKLIMENLTEKELKLFNTSMDELQEISEVYSEPIQSWLFNNSGVIRSRQIASLMIFLIKKGLIK